MSDRSKVRSRNKFLSKLIQCRGNYIVLKDLNNIEHILTYTAYNFDKGKFELSGGDYPKTGVKDWWIYDVKSVEFPSVTALGLKSLVAKMIKATFGEELEVGYVRIISRYSSIYLYCSVSGVSYNYIAFVVDSQRLYCTCFSELSEVYGSAMFCDGVEVKEEQPSLVHLVPMPTSKAFVNRMVAEMRRILLSRDICDLIVSFSNALCNIGVFQLEFPYNCDLRSCITIAGNNTVVYCEDLLADIQFYFTPVIDSSWSEELQRISQGTEINGYGMNLKNVLSKACFSKYGDSDYLKVLFENESQMGYNMYYPVGNGEFVFLEREKVVPSRLFIKEVRSIEGELLFYAVCSCSLKSKNGIILDENLTVYSTSLEDRRYRELLKEGRIPESLFLSIRGIHIKYIEDTDMELRLDLCYLGKDISISYNRITRTYFSEEFPNISGVDCVKFFKKVMRSLGYLSYRDPQVKYKGYISGKYISTYKSCRECTLDLVPRRGTIIIEKYNLFDKFLCKYGYDKQKGVLYEIK